MAFDQRAFRDAMGCFATGVTVVSTVTEDGRPVGITVNSFSSVSLEPPLVLFCIDREATNLNAFQNHGRFAINVLGGDQQSISNGFAGNGDVMFENIAHRRTEEGCPLIPDAIVVFECETEATYDGGDHVIFVGRVKRIEQNSGGEPLLYFRGRYAAVAEPAD
jgi:flavin reductase (DIM6/NTAB) family NADH-FMN oxidoreductase RutF